MDLILEPFTYAFFRHGFAAATIAGALCGLVGVFVVLRGMSYIGHGLSHAIFGGAAAAVIFRVNYFAAAGVWGIACALAIQRVARKRLISADAAIGVITTASFAMGIALAGAFGTGGKSFEALLFGSILGVGLTDVAAIGAVFIAAVAVITLNYRKLLFVTFDADVAEVSGLNVARIDALLMSVLAISLLASMQILGVTLIAAAIVVPAVIARMLTDSFARMLWLSAVIGAVSGAVGMLVSYYVDAASGATIVLTSTLGFGVVGAITGRRGRARAATAHVH